MLVLIDEYDFKDMKVVVHEITGPVNIPGAENYKYMGRSFNKANNQLLVHYSNTMEEVELYLSGFTPNE